MYQSTTWLTKETDVMLSNAVITSPTRFNPYYSITKFYLLDPVWSNRMLGCNHCSGAIDYDITDQLPVFYILSTVPRTFCFTYRSYADREETTFIANIAHTSFDSFYNCENVDRYPCLH